MKKNGKFLFFVAAVVMMSFAFVGCGGSSGSEAKLVYWTMWNEAEPQGMVIAEAVEAFTAETGIDVEVNFNGREIRKTLQPALDAGEAIDIFDEDIERVLTWGNYLLPLDEYVAKSYSTTGGQPYGSVVNQTLLNLAKELGGGSIRNIPYQPSAFVTMYNKDLFAKAGITSVPTNWNEFLAACEKLKALPKPKPACEYSDDDADDLFFDLGIARFNLCSFIENLEWKIDLKLFYAKSCLSD